MCTVKLLHIHFHKDRQELPHHHQELHLVDSITITLFFQKNDTMGKDVMIHRSGESSPFPVLAWSEM
eukprot:2747267-Ditylum_brightwellii.AAC.1